MNKITLKKQVTVTEVTLTLIIWILIFGGAFYADKQDIKQVEIRKQLREAKSFRPF
jgi:hypothetical protein